MPRHHLVDPGIREARGVCQQVPDGDRPRRCTEQCGAVIAKPCEDLHVAHVRNVLAGRVVEHHDLLLHELHQRHRGHGLGHRGKLEQRVLSDWAPSIGIPRDALVAACAAPDRCRCAHQRARRHSVGHRHIDTRCVHAMPDDVVGQIASQKQFSENTRFRYQLMNTPPRCRRSSTVQQLRVALRRPTQWIVERGSID